MENGLTQFDIDELARQGVDVTGLSVGYPATDDMRRRLGIQDDVDPGALPDPVSAAQVAEGMATTLDPQTAALNASSMDPAAVAGAMNAVPPAAPVTQEQLAAPKSGGLISNFGDMLFGPQEATDQVSNLNRQQRMMLAFGAIKDAGFALQGKEGNSFNSTLKAINDQIDIGRKAKAAAQKQQLLGGLGLDRQGILNAAAQGFIDGPTAKLMIEELDRQKTEKTSIQGKAALIARIDALMNDPNLEDALGFEGIIRGFASNIGLDDNVARVNEMIKQVRGEVFLEGFERLKGAGQITELEGQKAEQAYARLGQMQSYDDYVNSLKELRFYVDIFSRRLQGESIPDEMIYVRGAQNGSGSAGTEPLSDEDLDNLYPPTPTN